jgi:hypothetical protein
MNARTLFAIALAPTAAAVTVAAASPAAAALAPCGKVTAGGRTWATGAAAVPCAAARRIVGQVAVKKPDHVIRANGGEVDQYATSFSGLKCFRSVAPRKGGEIQCTSADGKKTVLATFRG